MIVGTWSWHSRSFFRINETIWSIFSTKTKTFILLFAFKSSLNFILTNCRYIFCFAQTAFTPIPKWSGPFTKCTIFCIIEVIAEWLFGSWEARSFRERVELFGGWVIDRIGVCLSVRLTHKSANKIINNKIKARNQMNKFYLLYTS